MKWFSALFLAVLLGCAGCAALDFSKAESFDVISVEETAIKGYFHVKYNVKCPGNTNELDVIPVDFYLHGDFFEDREDVLRYEYKRACKAESDGDGKGPENAEE